MDTLLYQKCEACAPDAPKVTQEEKEKYLAEIPEWTIQVVDNVPQLTRYIPTEDFMDALAFTNQVAELAEEYGHHPAIELEWGNVTVKWWTHKIAGLHKNDFIMAAKTDLLIRSLYQKLAA